jgi:hypothetical protein
MDPAISALIGALITTIGSIIVALIQHTSKSPPKDTPVIAVPIGTRIDPKPKPITWRTITWIAVCTLVGAVAGYILGGGGNELPAFPSITQTTDPTSQTPPTVSGIMAVDATPIDPDTATDYLKQIFIMWTLSGDLREDSESDKYVLSAFYSILVISGNSLPEDTMQDWIEEAKEEAARAIGGSVSEYEFLEFDSSGPFETLTLEESYRRLWEHVLKEPNPNLQASNMATIRLSLIASVGEEVQAELIGTWNK